MGPFSAKIGVETNEKEYPVSLWRKKDGSYVFPEDIRHLPACSTIVAVCSETKG